MRDAASSVPPQGHRWRPAPSQCPACAAAGRSPGQLLGRPWVPGERAPRLGGHVWAAAEGGGLRNSPHGVQARDPLGLPLPALHTGGRLEDSDHRNVNPQKYVLTESANSTHTMGGKRGVHAWARGPQTEVCRGSQEGLRSAQCAPKSAQ